MSRVGARGPLDPGEETSISPSTLRRELWRDALEIRTGAGTTSEGLFCLQASEVERQLSLQVHALREDFREKNSSTNQHIIRLESLQAEVSLGAALCGAASALLLSGLLGSFL